MPTLATKVKRAQRLSKPAAGPTEDEIHVRVVGRLRAAGRAGLFWHTPNQGKRSKAYASKLARMGVVAGVPDLIFAHRHRALELKTERGRLSAEQREVLATLRQYGWETAVSYGYDEAIAILENWGYL